MRARDGRRRRVLRPPAQNRWCRQDGREQCLSFLLGGIVELIRRRLTPGNARPAGAGKRKLRALVAATMAAAVLAAPAAAAAAPADEDRAGRQRLRDAVVAAGAISGWQLPGIGAFAEAEHNTARVPATRRADVRGDVCIISDASSSSGISRA